MDFMLVTVPYGSKDLVAGEDKVRLESIGLDEYYFIEMVLCLWTQMFQLSEPQRALLREGQRGQTSLELETLMLEQAYDKVIEALADTMIGPGFYGNDAELRRHAYLSNNADQIVNCAIQIFRMLYRIVGDMPMGDDEHPIDAVTVNSFHKNFMVLRFNFLTDIEAPPATPYAMFRRTLPPSRLV